MTRPTWPPSRVSPEVWEGWPASRVDIDGASLVAIPQLGAKIVSLTMDGDAADFIWRDETRPLRAMTYGDAFGDYDAGGFDECFPTIGECPYPDAPLAGTVAPDHGELWTARWAAETDGRTLTTRAPGSRFPYRFERRIAAGRGSGTSALTYRAYNLSDWPLKYLWSAHPLFAARDGMRVLMAGHPRGEIVFAGGGRIAESGGFTWPDVPTPRGGTMDYGYIGDPELRANDKVCVETPDGGWVGLFDPIACRYCALRVKPDEVPFIAVCVNLCWWPFTGRPGYWVALEPCTGYPDRLDQADAAGRGRTIEPRGSVEWSMELVVGRAGRADEVAERMARPE